MNLCIRVRIRFSQCNWRTRLYFHLYIVIYDNQTCTLSTFVKLIFCLWKQILQSPIGVQRRFSNLHPKILQFCKSFAFVQAWEFSLCYKDMIIDLSTRMVAFYKMTKYCNCNWGEIWSEGKRGSLCLVGQGHRAPQIRWSSSEWWSKQADQDQASNNHRWVSTALLSCLGGQGSQSMGRDSAPAKPDGSRQHQWWRSNQAIQDRFGEEAKDYAWTDAAT